MTTNPTQKLLLALALLGASTSFAQTTVLNWDADGGAGVGGTGAWDTTSTLWNTAGSGLANTVWTTGTGASGVAANFGGTGGTVTVQAGGITTGVLAAGNQSALNFDAGGYTLTGGKITIDNTGGGNDRTFFRFATGSSTTINNDVDITPSALGANTFNRLVQNRGSNSTVTFGGAINILGTTSGTHTLDVIAGGGATGFTVNFNGVIGDAAGAAVTRVRIGGNATQDLKDFTVRFSAANLFQGGLSGKGKILVANNTGLGVGGVTIGGDGQAGSGAILTDAAVSIANNIGSGNSAVSAITLGGNSAHVSSFTGNVDLSTNASALAGSKIGLQAVTGGTVTFSGLINDGANTIGVDKFGAGTVTLSRSAGNTFDGPVNVVNGTLLANNTTGSATGAGAVTVGSAANSLGGGATSNTSRLVTVTSTAGMVVGQTITGTNIPANTFVEQIKDGTTIVLSQSATGTATGLTLNLAASSAALGGTGIISGATTILSGSSLNAGNGGSTTETLAFGSSLTLNGGATTTFDLAGNTRGTQYDGIDVTGALTNGGALSINFSSAFLTGSATFDLFGGAGGDSGSTGSFSSVSIAGSYISTLTNSGGVWTGNDGAYSFSYAQATGDLTIAAIPEPSTFAALAGLGALGLVGLRRRRRA